MTERPYPQRRTYLQGWHLYKGAFIQHHLQGLGAGLIILLGPTNWEAYAALWVALYVCYQALSWLRKKDSPALDLTDFMVGMAISAPIAFLIGVLWN